jgi:hypothetical protein
MANKLPKPGTFQRWKTEFKWLEIKDNRMFCKTCSKWRESIVSTRNYNDTFVKEGSVNWQKSAVKEHDTSVPHVTAIDYEQRSVMGENYRKQVVK